MLCLWSEPVIERKVFAPVRGRFIGIWVFGGSLDDPGWVGQDMTACEFGNDIVAFGREGAINDGGCQFLRYRGDPGVGFTPP